LFVDIRMSAMDHAGGSCHGHRMRTALLLDAVRSPLGGRGGALAAVHPVDLLAQLLRSLAERSGLDAARVDDVLIGCAMPVGNQGFNVARSAVLGAGWPEQVPAGTIDRQGVSSFAAVAAAARAVASGACEIVVAGGVESMSTTPPGATLVPGAQPFGPAMAERYRDRGGLTPPGVVAEAFGLPRSSLDAYALQSHARAVAAGPDPAIVPVRAGDVTVKADELPRADLTLDERAGARGTFVDGGAVTALNSGAMADGAAVVVLVSEAVAAALDAVPLARIVATADVGIDPIAALAGDIPATRAALARAGLTLGDLTRIELAEPFAAVPLSWLAELGVDPERVNPHGGGISLGEPTGAVGARLVASLAHGLGGGTGLAAGVASGGLASAVVLAQP
jgi:acetyl-CoA acyltransferase